MSHCPIKSAFGDEFMHADYTELEQRVQQTHTNKKETQKIIK